MSITHNKNQNRLLNLFSSCTSAKILSQILSIKDECTLRFLKFLINGLCSYFANSCLIMISFLTPLPEDFLSKNL